MLLLQRRRDDTVSIRTRMAGGVCEDRLAGLGGLCKPDRFLDWWLQHAYAVARFDVREHLLRVARPAVEQCGDESGHLEGGVGEVTDVLERLQKLPDAPV